MISSFFFSVNVPRKQENEIKIRHWTVRQQTDPRWAFTQRDARTPCLPPPPPLGGGNLVLKSLRYQSYFRLRHHAPAGLHKIQAAVPQKGEQQKYRFHLSSPKKILYNPFVGSSQNLSLSPLSLPIQCNTVRNRLIDDDELNCQKSFPRNEKIYAVQREEY